MRTVTIQTTQQVSIEYELSGSLARVFAFLIDMVVVIGVYLFLLFLVLAGSDISEQVVLFFLPLALFLAYYYFSQLFFQGQTLGKKLQQIKVLRVDGKDPTPGDYLLRTLFLLPDAWFSFGIPAILLINTTPNAQRIGDLVAGTVVVKRRASRNFVIEDIRGIKTRSDHEVTFSQILQFSEADMLLIKTSLRRLKDYPNPVHRQLIDDLAKSCREKLNIEPSDGPRDSVEFLDLLLRDFIVLTR